MSKAFKRKQIFGIRTTDEFLNDFDELCSKLGQNRSEVARYCLKKFMIENKNNQDQFQKTCSELF